jgi:uncharacterized protein YqhQ
MTKGQFFKSLDVLEARVNEYLTIYNLDASSKFTIDKDGKAGSDQMVLSIATASIFSLIFNYEVYYQDTPVHMEVPLSEACNRVASHLHESSSALESLYTFFGGYDLPSMTRKIFEYVILNTDG